MPGALRGGNARYNEVAMPLSPESHPALVAAPPAGAESEPNFLRFGLRHLFAFVTAAAAFCALMASLSGVWAIVVGSAAALVAAHVFGTLLGTRLRDTSADVRQWKARAGSPDPDHPVAPPQPVSLAELDLPTRTLLARHDPLGKRRIWCMAAGTVVGLVGGGAAMAAAVGGDATWAGLAMGAVSCGVIGAWAALLGVNFTLFARQTLRQATESAPDVRRQANAPR